MIKRRILQEENYEIYKAEHQIQNIMKLLKLQSR